MPKPLEDYYRQLEGATIRQVAIVGDGYFAFPTLEVRLADGRLAIVSVQADPEGNGPGFLFGLPDVRPIDTEPGLVDDRGRR